MPHNPTNPPPADQLTYSYAAAAEKMDVSRRTIERWVQQKRIKVVKIGSLRLVPRAELERLIASNLAA